MTLSQAEPGIPSPALRAPLWSWALAHFFLRLATVSRLCPIRGLLGHQIKKWQGQRFIAKAHDGVKLEAIYIPAANCAQPPRQKNSVPVVMAHGWLEAKEYLLIREAILLLKHGFDVILVDLRAHGRSGGRCVTFGIWEKHDIAAVVTEAQRRGWVAERVLTYGHSLGAATMLQHAAIDPRVAGVVAMCPYVDMVGAVRSFHQAWAPWIDWPKLVAGFELVSERYGFSMADASPYQAVSHVTAPVLFVVGDSDRLLPDEEHTRRLVGAKQNGVCRYIQVPGAGHVSVSYKRWPGLDETIVSFLSDPDETVPTSGEINEKLIPLPPST